MAVDELELYTDEAAASFFSRRLSYVSELDLPASVQFDLARSSLTTDQLRSVGQEFERPENGWGFTPVLDHLLSRDPDKVPIGDLRQYQKNLVARGYAPPNARADGQWGPEWSSASFMFEDENRRQQMAGEHWASTTVRSGLEMVTNTLPSRLFQSIVGGARGIVEQSGETASRVGVLGGAGVGAAIGTAIAPGAGSLIGAGIGATVGFLGDLFTTDENEPENRSLAAQFFDALTPYEEYVASPGGIKAFWEDVGFTLTAAGMVAGVGMAVRGAAAIPGAFNAASSAVGGGSPSAMSALVGIGREPAWFGRMAERLIAPVTGEVFTAEFIGAARGVTTLLKPTVTGITGAAMSARYFGGIGQGSSGAFRDAVEQRQIQLAEQGEDRPLTEEELHEISRQTAGSTIEQAIAATGELRTGIDVPILGGDIVDLSSFFLNPSQFFPWKLGDIGKAATRMLGDNTLAPFAWAVQHGAMMRGESVSLRGAVEQARAMLGDNDVERGLSSAYMYLSAGLDVRAAKELSIELRKRGLTDTAARVDGLGRQIRAGLVSKLHDGSLSAQELIAEVTGPSEPLFHTWLINKLGDGNVRQFVDASSYAQRVTSDVRSGLIEIDDEIKGALTESQHIFNRLEQQRGARALIDQAKALEAEAATLMDPTQIAALHGQARGLRNQASTLQKSLPKLRAGEKTAADLVIAPALPTTPTFQTLNEAARRYDELRTALVNATKSGDDVAIGLARADFNTFVETMAREGRIPREIVGNALQASPGKKVSAYLKDKARFASGDADFLPQSVKDRFAELGYKPVVTSGDLLFLDDAKELANAMGAPQYSKVARIVETAGLSPAMRKDAAVFDLMRTTQRAAVEDVLSKHDVGLGVHDVFGRFDDVMREGDAGALIAGLQVGKGRLVDVRQLTTDRIQSALSQYAEITPEVARDIHRALHTSFGGEFGILRHPVDTMRMVGQGMRVNGLPGFADAIRSWQLPDPGKFRWKYMAGGAAVGGVTGALVGDDEIKDFVSGAAIGGLSGLGLATLAFGKNGYGYLPDRLAKLHNALRFTLSPTFDAGRYVEQNAIAAAEYGLRPFLQPEKAARKFLVGRRSPYRAEMTADTVLDDVMTFWDELTGGAIKNADALEQRMNAAGVLGFVPQKFEAVQAMQLYQKHPDWSREQILEAVLRIGRYGEGRSGLEKSVNFVLFPFSYSKKMITTAGDFFLQEPARRLVLHELMRRYYLSGFSEDVHNFIEEKAPLLDQISRITNFGAFGLSLGRPFLAGLGDKTGLGKAMELLTAFMVPSGAAQPIADLAGTTGDLAANFFMPVTLTSDQLRRDSIIETIMGSYIPAVRDLSTYYDAANEQTKVFSEGETGEAQLTDYQMELRTYRNDLEPIALAAGYTSVDGFLQSDAGLPFRLAMENKKASLAEDYPTGALMAMSYDSQYETRDAMALDDLTRKENPTAEEQIVLRILRLETQRNTLVAAGMPADLATRITTGVIRREAMKYTSNRTFLGLYDRFFTNTYGPILITR